MSRPPFPPFTLETAIQKVRAKIGAFLTRKWQKELAIAQEDLLYDWPLGRRSDDHPGLSALGL